MKKIFYFLLPLLIAFSIQSCDDEDQIVKEEQDSELKTTTKSKEKKLTDLFTSKVSGKETEILNAVYKAMMTECIFKYIDQMLIWGFPFYHMGQIIYKPDFSGIIGVSQYGDLVINADINEYNIRNGKLLMALKHEFIHLFQMYFCNTQLFGEDTGMAEFEVFVFLDILQRIEDKNNNTTTTGDKHEWALHTAYNPSRDYKKVSKAYLKWLDKLTDKGRRLPQASDFDTYEFAQNSKYFGAYNSYYRSDNTGYTYGNYSYNPCALKSLLTYMNNYCR